MPQMILRNGFEAKFISYCAIRDTSQLSCHLRSWTEWTVFVCIVLRIFLVYLNSCCIFTARCYAERGNATVSRLSVRPSVFLSVCLWRRGVFHTGWKTSLKKNSRPNSLRYLLTLTPTWAIWCNGKTPNELSVKKWQILEKNSQIA